MRQIDLKQSLRSKTLTVFSIGKYLLLISICVMQFYCGSSSGSSDSSGSSGGKPAVSISPVSGTVSSIFCVTLTCDESGYDIYYTLDGNNPSAGSIKYVSPIPVTVNGSTIDIKAAAFKNGNIESDIAQGSWTLSYSYGSGTPVTIITCATSSTVEGIDVSQWQGTIDWGKVAAAGKKFVFIRATSGKTIDSMFSTNWSGAKAAGILRAPYHTFDPDRDAVEQADVFLGSFTLEAGDLTPVVDVELTSVITEEAYTVALSVFINKVITATGKIPVIYTGSSVWGLTIGGGCHAFNNCPLSIAHWNVSCPGVIDLWETWTFWQYSSIGTVDGITGNVDLDRFNGTEQQLEALRL